MFEIKKTFRFEAAHRLRNLEAGHKCARMHGHNYEVTLTLAVDSVRELENGFVYDYGKLKPFGDKIKAWYDHRVLNEVKPFDIYQPSAEFMAYAFYNIAVNLCFIPNVVAVGVSETPDTYAEYRP